MNPLVSIIDDLPQGIAPTILDKANQTGDVHEFYRAFAGHIIGQAAGVLGTSDILAMLDEAKTHIADRAIIEKSF